MSSWDDDDEMETHSVTTFYFEDEDASPISFGELPILFSEAEKPENGAAKIFLRGTTDTGLHVYKQVIAWKLVLDKDQTKIMVMSKDNKWITLLKPRMSYLEGTIRTIMIAIQMLHFLRIKPEASEKSLWEHLCKFFSTFDLKPSFDDLRDHIPLLKLFTEKDETLAKSQVLLGFSKGKPSKKSSEDVMCTQNFKQSSDADDEVDEDGDELEDENYDSVCAICDNGGNILCCDGRCLRSFHATAQAAGEDSNCESLGLDDVDVEAIPTFLCNNCLYKQHQCFACGELGSSDKIKGAEVYPCVSATCGHFYHPKCIAKLLFPYNEAQESELEKNIMDGMTFTCPAHKCIVCNGGEKKNCPSLQFAVCRRCPTSYHRNCMPREIKFEDPEDESVVPRAWTGLLPHRILIYCLKHEIDKELGTPIRDHLKFPDGPEGTSLLKVKRNNDRIPMKRKSISVDLAANRNTQKKIEVLGKVSSQKGRQQSDGLIKRNSIQSVHHVQKKMKIFKGTTEPNYSIGDRTIVENNIITSGDKRKPVGPGTLAKLSGDVLEASFPQIDCTTERKAKDLIAKATSSFRPEDVAKMLTIPSTHAHRNQMVSKNITHGKVEGIVEAIKSALQKLEQHGSSVEDIQAVCEPEILKQLLRWHNKFKVYLAPFLHGMRYTSFGRHFTKVDKLKEIVDKLQWYVQSGDTIVDFCCGANDFSQLMKGKLDAAGKKCYFKNYDVIQPKNDINFERRDWMSVTTDELPDGSKLIMGLNPPFGVKAMLANKFIDKALTFKPKLIVLIVPRETKRLDQKAPKYDLIWEDGLSLSGKSFYLPGSVDTNDRQMDQWNLKPPVLYLWSHHDWTSKHKSIALNHGHMSTELKSIELEGERPLEAEAQVIPTVERTEHKLNKNKDAISEMSEKKKYPQGSVSDKRNKKPEVREETNVDRSSEMSISSEDHLEPTVPSTSCIPPQPIESLWREDTQDLHLGGRAEFRETLQSRNIRGNIPETERNYAPHDTQDLPLGGRAEFRETFQSRNIRGNIPETERNYAPHDTQDLPLGGRAEFRETLQSRNIRGNIPETERNYAPHDTQDLPLGGRAEFRETFQSRNIRGNIPEIERNYVPHDTQDLPLGGRAEFRETLQSRNIRGNIPETERNYAPHDTQDLPLGGRAEFRETFQSRNIRGNIPETQRNYAPHDTQDLPLGGRAEFRETFQSRNIRGNIPEIERNYAPHDTQDLPLGGRAEFRETLQSRNVRGNIPETERNYAPHDTQDLPLSGRAEFRETLQSRNIRGNIPETERNYAPHDYPISGTGSDRFVLQGSEGQFFNYARDMDTTNWNPYLSNIHDYGRPQEADWPTQISLHGGSQEEQPHQRNRYSLHGGSHAGNAHLPVMAPEVPSAIMRYAPRLDEINYRRPPVGQVSVVPGGGMSRNVPQDPTGFATGRHPSSFGPSATGGWLGD